MANAELKDRICRVLENKSPLHWEDLAAKLPGDLSDADLEGAVSELQSEGRIRYSGRDGGFRLSGARSPAVDGAINPAAAETATADVTTTVDERDGTVTAEFTVSATVTIDIDGRRPGDDEE